MHPNNPHKGRYDLQALIEYVPELKAFVLLNKEHKETINFHDPKAVKILNMALLKKFYGISQWDIPDGYLSPPIPGRADYIHHLSDLLVTVKGKVARGSTIKILDIGVGANCIYPLIGYSTFGWSFVGSDIDKIAIANGQKIIQKNNLTEAISLRQQKTSENILTNIIREKEYFDAVICNPPFHESAAAALKSSKRKIKNLKPQQKVTSNFGGRPNELWYKGGELNFITKLIKESQKYSTSVFWFTSLVSKASNIGKIKSLLTEQNVQQYKIFEMTLGNKISRIAAWTFLNPKQQKIWKETRWK